MPRLLAFGDVQLGAHPQYARKPGDRLRDQDAVLQQIADVAIEEGVDGILGAGDVFEGPSIPPEQLDVFARFIARLQGRIPVLAITGNSRHDLAMRDTNGMEIFNHIDGIDVRSQPGAVEFAGCTVGMLPWVHAGRLVAARGGGDRDEINAVVAQLLVQIAADLYSLMPAQLPRVLLGHWHTDVALDVHGNGIAQFAREPILPYAELEAIGYDAIVLGHNHLGQRLGERGLHVGSPLPIDFGEADVDHGVWILDLPGGSSSSVRAPMQSVDGQSNGSPAGDAGSTPASRSTFHPITSRRFVTFDEHLDAHDRDGLTLAFTDADVDEAIVRVILHGTSDEWRSTVDVAAIKHALLDAGAAVVRVQPDIVRADRARVEGLDEGVGELDALEQWMVAQGIVGVDEPLELAEPTRLLAEAMRTRTRSYLEAAA